MRAPPLPASFFKKNRSALLSKLPDGALAIIWANKTFLHNGDSTFPFKQNTSFYYLTGVMEEDAVLILLRRSATDSEEILCVKEATEFERTWLGKTITLEEASRCSGIEMVRPLDSFVELYHQRTLGASQLYFLLDEHARGDEVAHAYSNNYREFLKIKERYPLHKYERLTPLVNSLRMIKQQEEVAMIEEAIRVTLAGYRAILPLLKEGDIAEYVLEAELGREIVIQGGEGFAFAPIIAGGERSCILHYTQNGQRVETGSHVLIDMGASYGSYHADITRTFPVGLGSAGKSGVSEKFSRRFHAVYDAVERVHDAVLGFIRPGLTFQEYNLKVRERMMEELMYLGLIVSPDEQVRAAQYSKYFMHGISHFLGLEVHDVGERDGVFLENMVLTLEPGIYIREEGLGVRLENDILVTATGARNLSAKLPIQREEMEALILG